MVLTLVMLVITIGFSFGQEMPKFNTAEEKLEWVKNNPSEYDRLINSVSSLKPENGKPMMFLTQFEIDNAIDKQLPYLRKLIVERSDEKELVKIWREQMWRIENAELLKK